MSTSRSVLAPIALCLGLLTAKGMAAAGIPPVSEMLKVIESDKRRLVLRELYFLGFCIESYSVDHDAYPVPARVLVPVATLEAPLAPYSNGALPESDAWHSAYQFWSDGSNYVIISSGSDGRPEMAYSDLVAKGYEAICAAALTGQHDAAGTDYIFANGSISRWSGPKIMAPFD